MDKFLAIVCIIVVIAIIAAGEIYLKMDKHRTFAMMFLKRMNNGLDNWVQIADKLFESENVDSQTRTQYAELSEKFHNINKRHVYDKVAIINQMHDIASKVVCSDADKHDISELGHELTYAYLEFSNLQSEYNGSASAVNVALDKKMSGAIARVTRIHPMETMSDLTVL